MVVEQPNMEAGQSLPTVVAVITEVARCNHTSPV